MKTILNLIITTFGVLFILSACGGGAAPTITIGVVDQTCSTNAFSPDCDDGGQIERTDAITDCAEKGECDAVPENLQTCLTDLFSPECDAVAETISTRTTVTIAELQMTFCEANPTDTNCKPEPTLAEVCTDDPFNPRCLTDYNGARETACRANNTPACGATITRYCETEAVGTPANLFDTLCGDVKYNTPRETACRTGSHDLLCPATITRFCETDATPQNGNTLNPLCAAVKYNGARETACRTGGHANLCPATITRFCETEAVASPINVFNPLCGTYNTARETACRGDTTGLDTKDLDCMATIARFCTTTPTLDTYFDPLCVADTTAIMKRDEHCGMVATDENSPAFTMRCAENTEGLNARNTYCVIGDVELTGNALKPECALNSAGNAILLTVPACMNADAACLPSLRVICEADVASFNGLCDNARTALCLPGDSVFKESLCNVPAYEMDRETACVGGVTGIVTECNTLYTKHCGAGAENPFNTTAGLTARIDCTMLPAITDQTDFAIEREKFCGNSRPVADSTFETQCNEIIVNLCTPNPYDTDAGGGDYDCSVDAAFVLQRETRRETCRVDGAATGENCANLVAFDACIGDPFYSTCDDTEYMEEQTARQSYCTSGVQGSTEFGEGVPVGAGTINDVDRLCGTFRTSICSWDLMSEVPGTLNPTMSVCPNDDAGQRVQTAYCAIGNNWNTLNTECSTANTTFAGCIENPFELTAGEGVSVCGTETFALVAMANRIKFCSGDVDVNDADQLALCVVAGQDDAEGSLCASSGVHANPFVDFCAREGTTFDMVRAEFLTNCKNSDTSVLDGATTCAPVLACDTDPYSTDCAGKSVYSPSRQRVVDECDGLGVDVFTATCTQQIKESIQACLTAPYSLACKDNRDYDNRRTARLGECQDLGMGSDAIRGGADETKCRGAINDFCTGDNLFATDGLACFGDNAYKSARDTHFAECKKATSARVGTDCTLASAQICVGTESEYTDPFVTLCDEGSRDSLLARQAVILRCQPLSSARGDKGNESCETIGANRVLDNCDNDPLAIDCVGYNESDGLAYFSARATRLNNCAAEEGPTNHQNTCTGAILVLCANNNPEVVPFSPVCNNESGIAGIRNSFLVACMVNNYVPAFCQTASINAIRTGCADTTGNDPYNTAVTVMGSATLNCNDFDFFNGARGTRLTGCSDRTITTGCDGTISFVCRADGANANPFHATLCNTIPADDLAISQRDFCQIRANVGKAGCTSGDLTRPTAASVLAGQTPELGTTPASGTNQTNEFLKGTDTGLNTGGFVQANGAAAEVITINMSTAKYNNVLLGGDLADGIAFFGGHAPDNSLRVEYYAGILAGADLGAPLRQETNAEVKWYGAVNWAIAIVGGKGFAYHDQTAIGTTTRDFVLTIDLENRSFRSFFQRLGTTFNDGAQGFLLTGDYHPTTGVIMNGKVLFGVKSGDEILRNGESGATYHFEGPLIGIIGAEGALGVFYAQRSNDGQGDALGGGFVARAPRSDFISWTRYAANLAGESLTIRTVADAGDSATSFIRGGTAALDVGTGGVSYTLTLADNYSLEETQHRIVSFGGEAVDGVSFAVNGDRLYSGLLSGTDLGAPLRANANYQGRIGIIIYKDNEATYEIAHDFTLQANFGAGTFSTGGATLDGKIFALNGRFNQFGLLRGTMFSQPPRASNTNFGTITGLIGADGVIGAFKSDDQTAGVLAYAGGFVARADDVITTVTPNARRAADWEVGAVENDGTTRLPVLQTSAAIGAGQPLANFYKGVAGGLNLGLRATVQNDLLTFAKIYSDNFGDTIALNGGTTDGVAFASVIAFQSTKLYVGLLSDTALGQPVSHTAPSAKWYGQFALLVRDELNSGAPYFAPFVLNVNFRDRRIDSSSIRIPASVLADGLADEFKFSGNYDGHGVIRGTVSYKNNGDAGAVTTTAGHLSGLIGEDGAVGGFISNTFASAADAYTGGFVARPPDAVIITKKVTFGDWAYSFGTPPPIKLDPATPRNQFLEGERDRLNLEGVSDPQAYVISVASQIATFDGIALGLERNDGMGFFSGDVNGTEYFYAGILSDTDLGAPVGTTFDSETTGKWNGRFGYRTPVTYYEDFTLEIDFANPRIEAFVAGRDGNYFHLNGSYDANGAIINGTVDYGAFTAGTRTPSTTRTPNGTLTGIIGQQGAIGAFISSATGNAGYAGGFVVTPTAQLNPDLVNYKDWVRSFGDTPPPLVPDVTAAPLNQFLQGFADTLPTTGITIDGGAVTPLNLATATFDGIALGGQTADGVGFFQGNKTGGVGSAVYAGIFNGTDLGAPVIADSPKAYWYGQFVVIGTFGVNTDFTLEVDFTADALVDGSVGSIEAFVQQAGPAYYHLEGTYDANGVIKGVVDYGFFTAGTRTPTGSRIAGTLTGLIGQDGAVGAFISGRVNTYAGGFVAVPNVMLDPNVVNYNDWAHSFATPPPNQLDTSARHNQFLGTVAGATLLDGTGINNTPPERQPKALTLSDSFDTITFAGDPEDGVSFFWDNWGTAGYSGILASTDLGALVTQGGGPAEVEWKGIFQAFVGSFASVLDIKRNFVLEIDFTNNANKIEAFVQQTGEFHYHLTGSFDENGVITGKVDFGEFTDATRDQKATRADNNGFLTGLIGEQGAVGAFLSGTGTRDSITTASPILYSGGFVASPNVVNHVKYIDWTGSFTTTLTDTMLNPTDRVSQFLAAATALDETGAGTINAVNKGSLTLANATFKGAGLGGQAADGVSWFWDSTNDFGYAGILAGTDLGAPLTQDSGTAKWNGSFQTTGDVTINDDLAITYSISGGRVKVNTNIKRDFLLEIDFDNDEIEAFIYHFGTRYYHLTGNFVGGVITGKVNYGTFTDLAARTATDGETIGTPRAPNGILTGLIGAYGAVGAFISGTGDKNAIATADPVYYAGGFVATPTNALDDDTVNSDNVVNYDDWLRGFITLPPDRLDISSESRRGQFLAWNSGRNDLDRTGSRRELSNDRGVLTLATTFSEITITGGQAADGVSFFYDSWGAAGYAGIRSSTNLGAPLTQDSGTANWNGHIRSVGTYINREFVLEIDFADGNKIEAFVQTAGEDHFHLTGSFDASGVITGKVNYGRFTAGTRTPTDNRADNGFLTGLIGMEGAVGAFVSGTGTKDAIVRLGSGNYSGGFVAHPTATSTGVNVKFNDWVRTVGPSDAINTTFQNQFLRGTPDNIPAMAVGLGSETNGTGTITPTLLTLGTTLGVSGDTKNGVGFFEGYDTVNGRYYYAGIFNGADLGAPLTAQTAAGVWKGKFQVLGSASVDTDFTLGVTFETVAGFSEVAGKVDAFVQYEDDFYYHLTGTYDRNGVITGDVDFGKFMNADKTMPETIAGERVGGTLNGLIGSNGALGVFHSDKTGSGGYAGGFVACKRNTADTGCKE